MARGRKLSAATKRKMSEASKKAWVKRGAWAPPPEHARHFAKLRRCGFDRQQAQQEIERLIALEAKEAA